MFSITKYLLLIAVLLAITQITRFENEIIIKYDNQNMTISMQEVHESFYAPDYNFTSIDSHVQQSIGMQGGMTDVKITDSHGNAIYEHNPLILYLFGRDWTGNILMEPPVGFTQTFGDWYLDQFDSETIEIYNETLPKEFSANIKFAGRGRKTLFLQGDKSVWIGFSDGFIDSTFAYCNPDCKNFEFSDKEPIFRSIIRIVNLFAEAALVTATAGLAVFLLKLNQKR
jgi:hypothetical protein